MSQFLSQSLTHQMRMEQKLTPQLIQSMSILQKSITDLESYVNEALETNAALDVKEREAPAVEDGETPQNGQRPGHEHDDARFGRLDGLARDYNLEWNDRSPQLARRAANRGEYDAKMGALANTPGRSTSLHEHLQTQWSLLDLNDDVQRAGEAIITHLDPDGYLRVELDAIARSQEKPIEPKALEQALQEIHTLDPPGIGAHDLKECLLLQLEALPGDNGVERTLIEDHIDDIVHNRLPAVAKATGYSIGEINEAIKALRSSICIHPGYLVGDRSVPAIRPDVVVDYADTGGGLTVRLARGNLPELRIRDEVVALAKNRKNDKDSRDFARKQVESALAIIDAVNFRRSRLLEVARSVVEKQRDFFDVGPEGLKVFRMNDLALELGCDPSTVSRTVAEKYMQTPRGMYPMRYFFTGGTESEDGDSVGWDRVKTRVKELVEGEDRKLPLNDDQIAVLLKEEGMAISRRTVAKYRQQLAIPAARQRKEF